MGAAEPDDCKKGLLLLGVFFDESEGFGDNGIGAIAGNFDEFSFSAEGPIGVEPV